MSQSCTKKDLVTALVERTKLTAGEAHDVIQITMEEMTKAFLKGQRIELRDFGVFEVRVSKAKLGRNPKKPEQTVTIPARRTIRFKPGKNLSQLLNP